MPAASPARADRPPREEFWERYNRRREFPVSTTAAVLLHVAAGALLVFLLARFAGHGPDRAPVPVRLVDLTDDEAAGASADGVTDAVAPGANPFDAARAEPLPDPERLPAATPGGKRAVLDDPNAPRPAAANTAAEFDRIDKLLAGRAAGAGRGAGAAGPTGSGADSTRARSLRWVLRFQTADGEDYVRQLAAMGATVLIPLPPDDRAGVYVPDLRNPASRRPATDDDLRRLSGQVRFSDTRPASVAGVCAALGVREPARSFWAFFPRELEDELARKEQHYRNRRQEDVEETVFRVVVRGGACEVVVWAQTPRR